MPKALYSRQLGGCAELGPTDAVVALEDERRVSRTGQHPRVLQLSLGLERADLTLRGTLGVEAQAPAATEDAVVELDQRAVGRPRALI